MKRLLIALILLTGFCAVSRAENLKTIESDGLYSVYYSSTNDDQIDGIGASGVSNRIATHSVVGLLTSFSIEAVGGDVLFSLSHSTGGYRPDSSGSDINTYYTYHETSRTLVRAGTTKSFDLRGRVVDPWIKIYSLNANTTAHVTMETIRPIEKSTSPVVTVNR